MSHLSTKVNAGSFIIFCEENIEPSTGFYDSLLATRITSSKEISFFGHVILYHKGSQGAKGYLTPLRS